MPKSPTIETYADIICDITMLQYSYHEEVVRSEVHTLECICGAYRADLVVKVRKLLNYMKFIPNISLTVKEFITEVLTVPIKEVTDNAIERRNFSLGLYEKHIRPNCINDKMKLKILHLLAEIDTDIMTMDYFVKISLDILNCKKLEHVMVKGHVKRVPAKILKVLSHNDNVSLEEVLHVYCLYHLTKLNLQYGNESIGYSLEEISDFIDNPKN